MKYYIIAGEASGDLHAAHLMRALRGVDKEANFRFFGGDLMAAEGGARVKHYKDMAYMGFVQVLMHLGTIFKNMSLCKHDIMLWQPDVVILVDYPGFNLSIAKYVHKKSDIPVFYYISPKIWAWKEYRIRSIKRDVSQLFSILPFEVPFFEEKHHYPIHYVGNPTLDEVNEFAAGYREPFAQFSQHNGLTGAPVIALLAGSRKQEIKDNLPAMLKAVQGYDGAYQIVIAGAPSIPPDYYASVMAGAQAKVVFGQTYALLSHATAAVVTGGTATLETALFGVPQVVCYKTPIPKVMAFLRRHLLKVPYVSLVNLICNREVVRELVADTFTIENITRELSLVLPSGSGRQPMLDGYKQLRELLGDKKAPDNAACIMYSLLADKG